MAQRGGRRSRDLPVGVPISCWGRWGRRRARVEHCAEILLAEAAYEQLLGEGTKFGPGSRFTRTWMPGDPSGPSWPVAVEVVANAVWRRGRVFFRCGHCEQRGTRLYVPIAGLEPRCRRCWGLSYECQSWSYKSSGASAALGSLASWRTADKREELRAAARARYKTRRAFLNA